MIVRRREEKKEVKLSFRVAESTRKSFEELERSLAESGMEIDADEVVLKAIKLIKKASAPGTRSDAIRTGGEQ
jgi:hypothetical protein